jgi:hypothetical protein
LTLAGSKRIAQRFYYFKNLKTCIAVLLFVGYTLSKAKEPYVNNGFDTSQTRQKILQGKK